MGLSAALTSVTAGVLHAWNEGRHADFVAGCAEVDALARLTFHEPMDDYVRRMGWVAAWQGLLPGDVCVGKHRGSGLDADARRSLVESLDETFGHWRTAS